MNVCKNPVMEVEMTMYHKEYWRLKGENRWHGNLSWACWLYVCMYEIAAFLSLFRHTCT